MLWIYDYKNLLGGVIVVKKVIVVLGIGVVVVFVSFINVSVFEKGIVIVSVLNIRSGLSFDCDKVVKLYKGKIVEILEKFNGWYKVRVLSFVVGWGSVKYILISGLFEGILS